MPHTNTMTVIALVAMVLFVIWKEIDWRDSGVRALISTILGGIALVLFFTPVELLAVIFD